MTISARPILLATLPALALFAAGCEQRPGPAAARVYAVDLAGKARTCTVPDVKAEPGKPADATMSMSGEGGWCGIPMRQANGRHYGAGLVQARPQHGAVHVHIVGDDTRVDYTPDTGFTGADKFSVRLIPGNVVLNVAVTVTPPQR